MGGLFFLDKKPAASSSLPLRALFYGEGVFETFRFLGGLPPYFHRHMERMERGARTLGIPMPGRDEVEEHVTHAVKMAGTKDASVKVCLLSCGEGSYFEAPGGRSIMVVLKPYSPPPREMTAAVAPYRRCSLSPLAGIKSISYTESILARRWALAMGYDEAILLNERGFIAECSSANIFFIMGGRLLTPPLGSGCLPGITRALAMECALEAGMRVEEKELPQEAVFEAEGMFLTNSLIGAVSLVSVGGCPLPPVPPEFFSLRDAIRERLKW
jgi:branched-subunit amino acid aminotransferase/4-amino-4-deoxychorismate lyase